MIKISESDYIKILKHAEGCLPEEACGLIAGEIKGDEKLIRKVYLLTNTDHSNEHFSLDPKEQLAAVKDMRAEGLVPLGNWHSHPESPSGRGAKVKYPDRTLPGAGKFQGLAEDMADSHRGRILHIVTAAVQKRVKGKGGTRGQGVAERTPQDRFGISSEVVRNEGCRITDLGRIHPHRHRRG